MKTLILTATLGFMLGAVGAAYAAETNMFLKQAIQNNNAEIQLGELAQKNGGSQGVKDFGKMLVTDHSKAKDKVMVIAKSKNVEPSGEVASDDEDEYKKLEKVSGEAFDKAFIDEMLMDHQRDIESYRKEAAGDDDVAAYARESLPVLNKHLEAAKALKK